MSECNIPGCRRTAEWYWTNPQNSVEGRCGKHARILAGRDYNTFMDMRRDGRLKPASEVEQEATA